MSQLRSDTPSSALDLGNRNFVGAYLGEMAAHQLAAGPFPPTLQDIQVLDAAAKLLDVPASETTTCSHDWSTNYKALYHELIYQVGNVHPNETRHQTALRYLQQAERGSGASSAAASSSPSQPSSLADGACSAGGAGSQLRPCATPEAIERLARYLRQAFEPMSEVTLSDSYLSWVASEVAALLSQ